MQKQIQELLEAIKQDYIGWGGSSKNDSVKQQMAKEFCESLSYKEGKKYIKVIKEMGHSRSVWGFIVKEDGPKFRKGDILKAASWQAPALNSPRGNILDGGYTIRWTGPLYLN